MSQAQLIPVAEGALRLVGRVDYDTVPALALQMESYWRVASLPRLSIDMSQVSHINTAGVALLIDWFKQAQKKGIALAFSHIPSQLARIAALTRVDKILNFTGVASYEK